VAGQPFSQGDVPPIARPEISSARDRNIVPQARIAPRRFR